MRIFHLFYEAASGRILLAVLSILFTLCVGPANSASEPGTVTIVLEGEPLNLDPGDTAGATVGPVLIKNVVESLTELNLADSTIMPKLATSWKQIDANTWHFFLRKGVKFQDGQDFNAAAVVFNLNRLYDKRITSRNRVKFFSNLRLEGKALDSHTLEIKTDKLEPLLLTLLTNLTICSPNTPLDKWTRNPIGTGPYKFVKWDAGMQIILERFDGYWGEKPQVKKAIYVWRSESSVRAAMVSVGEADLVVSISKHDANRPDMDCSYVNAESLGLRIGGIWEPPFNDRRVRMALNYAVDRDVIRESIFSNDVAPATQLIGPNIFGYNPNLKVWPYDPKKAKQLIDEARKDGLPVDKEIVLVGRTGMFPGFDELLEAMATMYRAVGLNAKVRQVESVVYNTRYRAKPFSTNVGLYMVVIKHDNTLGDAGFSVFWRYHCKGDSSSMCDNKVDDLIEKAQVAAAGSEQRKNLWQAAFKRIHEEIIPEVMLFHLVAYARVGKRINFKPSPATSSEIPLAEITFKQ